MAETETALWACPNCGLASSATYCSRCGERRLGHHDLTLLGLAEQVIETIGHVDGRIVRTLRALVAAPGTLTAAYVTGVRRAYIGPFQLFLILNLLFFGAESVIGSHIFSTPLTSQVTDQVYSGAAERLVQERLAATGMEREAFAPIFDHAVIVNAKSLVIVMVPPFALAVALLFLRSGRPVVTHVVFALHFLGFVLLQYVVLMALHAAVAGGLAAAGSRMRLSLDAWVPLQMALYVWYLHGAIRRTYGRRGPAALASAVALTAATVPLILGYRFVVFLFTLYRT